MNKYLLTLLLFLGLYGCHTPTEIKVPDSVKPADEFARHFIGNVISGKIDSSFTEINSSILNDTVKQYITNAYRNINAAQVTSYRVVGLNWTSKILSSQKLTFYRLGYEYTLDNRNILFTTTVQKDDNKYSIVAFNGQFLPAPLSELTKFTLHNKSIKQYVFLLFVILIPIFILISLIVMLTRKLSTKKKIIWALIILLISLPRFLINWNTGQIDFNLLYINILGAGVSRPTLYSAWILTFNIPIGAILFWIKRKRIIEAEQEANYYAELAEERSNTDDDITESGSQHAV